MLSRILAIVVTALSIAFLGFAGVVTLGGPNWQATARSMTEYKFTRDPGPSGQWTATSPDGESVGSSKVLPSVIVSALEDKNRRLQERLGELTSLEPQLAENEQRLTQQMEADKQALEASLARERERLSQLQQQAAQLSNQIVQQSAAGTAVEQEVSARRGDVFRLQNQLEILRADEARIEQIHRQMADLIEQIDADLNKARLREQQLRSRLGK